MLVDKIRNNSLCDELQLGDTLNQSAAHGQRARFQLLLSMLSQNVCDQAQFSMIKQAPKQVEQDLRSRFQLSASRPLKAQADEYAIQAKWSESLHTGDVAKIRLEQALGGYAVCAEDKVDGLAEEVMNNLDLLSRLKHQLSQPEQAQPAQMQPDTEVNGVEMYKLLSDFDYSKPLSVKYFN
ncbi:VC2046/SO_2500 family protein [Agarivorans sp.]|uniref:VC2046/SO_2500 family protein n=1 Tax=Agarivorans sp. TaxID=1872412 RepID=UPI003CFF2B8F